MTVYFPVAYELASRLIPRPERGQPFFEDDARSLLAGMLHCLFALAPGRTTLRDVILLARDRRRLEELLRRSPLTRHLADRYFRDEHTADSVLATLCAALAPFELLAAADDGQARDEPPGT
jgi:hypothetical protein